MTPFASSLVQPIHTGPSVTLTTKKSRVMASPRLKCAELSHSSREQSRSHPRSPAPAGPAVSPPDLSLSSRHAGLLLFPGMAGPHLTSSPRAFPRAISSACKASLQLLLRGCGDTAYSYPGLTWNLLGFPDHPLSQFGPHDTYYSLQLPCLSVGLYFSSCPVSAPPLSLFRASMGPGAAGPQARHLIV